MDTEKKNIVKLYHGTSVKNALSILQNGFDLGKAGENWGTTYGKGVYFTPNYETAKFYAGEDGVVLSLNLKINPSTQYDPQDPPKVLGEKLTPKSYKIIMTLM